MLVSHEGWILDLRPHAAQEPLGRLVRDGHDTADQVHLGNMVIKTLYDFDRLEELRVGNLDTLDGVVRRRSRIRRTRATSWRCSSSSIRPTCRT